ncbi:hypothetical protein ACFPVY_00490 [Flavobacterium qiangtangense]|uniref:DUF4412 domain-containing protein n=1 Tax=Flavobacterium qiangtangense TaxID=1442595 RepID=A0ABW1PHU9_9FLAO
MKKIVFFFLLLSFSAFAQNFEGEISYDVTYKSENPQLKPEQLASMMGNKQTYTIKDGNYKSAINGQMLQWQLYVKSANKLYTKMSNSESVFWNDASVQGDEVISAKVNKGVIEILGYNCDELVLECKSGVQKYYFNSKLAVDPALFVNHKFGNWYDFVSRSKALPLKSIVNSGPLEIHSVATKVTPKKLEASFFSLPAGVKLEKSPY